MCVYVIFKFLFHSALLLQTTQLTVVGGLLPLSIVIISVFTLDYYIEAVAATKLEATAVARNGAVAIFCAALVFSLIWSHPFIEKLASLSREVTEDHLLSGGVIFSFVLMLFG